MNTQSSPLLKKELDNFAFLAASGCQAVSSCLNIFNPNNGYYTRAFHGDHPPSSKDCCLAIHSLCDGNPLEVNDLTTHPVLSTYSCLDQVRYLYALPLEFKNPNLQGLLIILDDEARALTPDQKKSLELIGDLVVSHIRSEKNLERVKVLEERVKEATRIGRLGYWEMDYHTGELFWSDEVYRICEVEQDFNVSREAFYALVHPEDRESLKENRDKIIDGKQDFLDMEHRLLLNNGKLKWVNERGYIIRNQEGRAVSFQGTIQEITEQKVHQQSAQDSSKFIESTLDNVPLGVVVNRISTGELTYVNPYFTELFGWKMEELETIENSLYKVLPDPEVRQKRLQQVGEYLSSGQSEIMEWKDIEAYSKENKPLKVNINTIPLYDQDLVISTVVDETESYKIKEDLQASNDRFQLVSKAAWETIYDWDIRDGIRTWSQNDYINLGDENGDSANNYRRWLIRLHPDDRNRILTSLDETLNSDELNWAASYRFRDDDGKEYLHLRDRGHIIRNEKGEPLRMVGAVLNITEEVKREQQLKIFESAIANTKDAVLITEIQPNLEPKDYPICYCNRAYEKLSGYTMNELLGETPTILHGPLTDPSEIHKAVKNIGRSRTADVDIVNYKKNGDPYWVNLSISPVIDQKGVTTHYISIQREISLQKAEKLNRDIIQKISQIFSRSLPFKEVLQETIDHLGKALPIAFAELRLVNEYSGELELQAAYCKKEKYGAIAELHKIVDHRSGNGIHAQIFSEIADIAITDLDQEDCEIGNPEFYRELGLKAAYGIPLLGNKQLIGTLVVYSKYTAINYRKIMDRRMQDLPYYLGSEIHRKQLLEQLELIFSSVPDLICTADSNGFVKKINNTVTDQFGYDPQDIIGRHFTEFVYKEDLEKAIEEFRNVVEGKPTPYFEVRYLHKNGEPRWLAWSINVPDQGGDIFCVAKDISEKKNIEEELLLLNERLQQKNEKLAVSNAELEQFAYVASHDLQEPLRMISGFLTQLSKKYDDILDEKGKTYIHYAVDGAKRMRNIIMDLLEYSRLGRSEEIRTQVDVNQILDQIESMYGILINRTNGTIERPDNLPQLYTYQVLLFQVFQNLIDNALKYRREDVAPLIRIDYQDLGSQYEFSVSDNGIGIPEAYYDKIFVIFQRLHTKSEYGGTGMGLTTTKKILEVLGGDITVESKQGEGSTFKFTVQKLCENVLDKA